MSLLPFLPYGHKLSNFEVEDKKYLIKTHNLPSKIGNFQHLPCFRSTHEAPWMQIFVFLQPMRHQ